MTAGNTDITITDPGGLAALIEMATAPRADLAGWGSATSCGSVRPENEDAIGNLGRHLFVVADGMGGHTGGRMAATTAVQSLLSTASSTGLGDWNDVFRRVSEQIRTATRARGHHRAGTTLCVARVIDGVVTIAHVGDSRVYRRRGSELVTLTNDHTVTAELTAAGIAPHRQPRSGRHALTRHLGGADGNHMPEVTSFVPHVHDRLVMMTDGVFKQLDDAAMATALDVEAPSLAAGILVSMADEAGGRDNATAIVMDFGARS